MADGTINGTTIRMTYAELATARGISLDAARRLVLRKRWPKQIGNDGLTRALIPTEYAEPVGRDVGTDNNPNDGTDDGTDTLVILADEFINSVAQTTAALILDGMSGVQTVLPSLQEAVTALRAQLDDMHHRVAEERERAHRAEERVRELQEKLETELVEHQRVVGVLTGQLVARHSWWPWRR